LSSPEATESSTSETVPEGARTANRTAERFALGVFGASVVALLLAVVILSSVGTGSRRVDAVLATSDTAQEVVTAAGEMHAHGCVLLVATQDLGYASYLSSPTPEALKWPVDVPDYVAEMTSVSQRDNWAYVLARTGVARRIDYVLPESAYRAKVEAGRAGGFPGIARDGSHIAANDEGYLRYISTRPMKLGSPLVLIVDASYFIQGTSEELLSSMNQLPTLPAAVIIYRATDDPEVTDDVRAALDSAVPQLEEALQL